MASSQAYSRNSTPRLSGHASTGNDFQSTKSRSQSFNRKKSAAGNARPLSYVQSVHVTSAKKDTSTTKYATSNAYKGPTATSSQQKTRQQPDMMLLEPEVVFLQTDITKLKADVIVCPVGRMLETTAGISRVVMEKAGSGLRRAFVEKRKEVPLPIGHAFVTQSFSMLNCKHIIHVVVPKMPEIENPSTCVRGLEKAFDNCFEELRNVQKRAPAGMGKVETLAIPALGAGTNKIPKELVAEVMCDEVRKFLGRRKSLAPHLRKIFLVSLDHEMLSLLSKEWDVVGPTGSRDAKVAKSGDKGSGISGSRTEPLDARGGVTYILHGKGSPSMPGGTCYDSPISSDRGGLTGHRLLHLHSPVARGGTSGDRGGKNYLLSGEVYQSKVSFKSKNGWTLHDTDSDSDSKQGACGGAYGPKHGACGGAYGLKQGAYGGAYDPKSLKGYPPNGQNDWAAIGQASGTAGNDSDSGNEAFGSDYGFPGGIGHDLPYPQSGYSYNNYTNPRSGQRRRSESADDFFDENSEATLDKTKSLTIKDKESCPICFDSIFAKNSESLPMCGHKVCKDCWKELKLHNPVCPVCRKVYGELRGNQPEKAQMSVKTDQRIHLPGYERFGTIVIDYVVPDGRQTEEHPNPRKPFKGTQRRAYLPNNAEGKEVLRLLEKAFKARLIFTIGRSVTSGSEDVVTWNDIHHKTNISGQEFGYPDPTYLTRVKEELAAKGIK